VRETAGRETTERYRRHERHVSKDRGEREGEGEGERDKDSMSPSPSPVSCFPNMLSNGSRERERETRS